MAEVISHSRLKKFLSKFRTPLGVIGGLVNLAVLIKHKPWRIVEFLGDMDFLVNFASSIWGWMDSGWVQLIVVVVGLTLIWFADGSSGKGLQTEGQGNNLKHVFQSVDRHVSRNKEGVYGVVWNVGLILTNRSSTRPIKVGPFQLDINKRANVVALSTGEVNNMGFDIAMPSTINPPLLHLNPDKREGIRLLFVEPLDKEMELKLNFSDELGEEYSIELGEN